MDETNNPFAHLISKSKSSITNRPDSGRSSGMARSNASHSASVGKVPPHSLESERGVLGGILLDNSAIDRVIELGLMDEDFYQEGHKKIFATIIQLNTKGEPADIVTVSNALRASGSMEGVGGASYLSSLLEHEFSAANVAAYAKIIKESATLRRFISTSDELSAKAYSGVENFDDFIDEAEKKIFQVTEQKASQGFDPIKTILLRNFQQIEEQAANDGSLVGVPSGFTDLDRHTSGWQPGQLIVLAARPGMGKTSFMLNMALNSAMETKKTVALFSMEMSKEELCMRLLATNSRVDSYRLKTGNRLKEQDWKNLQLSAATLAECPIFLDDTPALNILELKSRCRRLQSRYGLSLVFVDYLQLMRGLGGRGSVQNREQEISEISRGLKALAKELQVPIIAASQLNRGVEQRTDKRPMLSDLRESGAIEQDADLVMFIYRDDHYTKEASEEPGIAEIIIGKHRAGSTGTTKLRWMGQYTSFENLAPEERI